MLTAATHLAENAWPSGELAKPSAMDSANPRTRGGRSRTAKMAATKTDADSFSGNALRCAPGLSPVALTLQPYGRSSSRMAALVQVLRTGADTGLVSFIVPCSGCGWGRASKRIARQTGQVCAVCSQVTRHDEPMPCLQGRRI